VEVSREKLEDKTAYFESLVKSQAVKCLKPYLKEGQQAAL
jgi:hypothetical protein